MSQGDILAAAVLIAAYVSTWILFLRSLHIVNILDKKNISGLEDFKKRFGPGKRKTPEEEG